MALLARPSRDAPPADEWIEQLRRFCRDPAAVANSTIIPVSDLRLPLDPRPRSSHLPLPDSPSSAEPAALATLIVNTEGCVLQNVTLLRKLEARGIAFIERRMSIGHTQQGCSTASFSLPAKRALDTASVPTISPDIIIDDCVCVVVTTLAAVMKRNTPSFQQLLDRISALDGWAFASCIVIVEALASPQGSAVDDDSCRCLPGILWQSLA